MVFFVEGTSRQNFIRLGSCLMNNISCATFLLPLLWLLWLLDSFWWIRFARSLCSFVLLVVFLDENSSFGWRGFLLLGGDDDSVIWWWWWWRCYDGWWRMMTTRYDVRSFIFSSLFPSTYLSIHIWLFLLGRAAHSGNYRKIDILGHFDGLLIYGWMCLCVIVWFVLSWYCSRMYSERAFHIDS